MDKRIKKVRPQSCNSESGKRKTFTVKSVAETPHKVKCVVATKELNAYQKSVIRRIYYASHERHSLVSNLKNLSFCTYSVALRYLKERGLIDNEDYYSLITEV
nr:MAG TPA: hypothetical protein [Caudoviricetes sp.]